MNILHFHPSQNMAELFVQPLIDAEREEGFRSELVYSSSYDKQKLSIPFQLSLNNLFGLPLAFLKIRQLLKDQRIEVVVCHNSISAAIPLLAAWSAGIPKRIYFNHGVPYVGHRGLIRWALKVLEYFNCMIASGVLTVSRDMIDILAPIARPKVPEIIHHGSASGIDLDRYSADFYIEHDWRKLYDIQDDDLVVVYVGRPVKRKGFDHVLSLWANHIQDPTIKLVLCGVTIEDSKKRLEYVPSNIIHLGFVNNVPEVLASSDILILPSRHEGLSYACMEAQAMGLLVLANNVPGITAVINHKVNGFLVNDNDEKAYAEVIKNFEKKKSYYATLSLQGQKDVRRFSRTFFLLRYISMLKNLKNEI